MTREVIAITYWTRCGRTLHALGASKLGVGRRARMNKEFETPRTVRAGRGARECTTKWRREGDRFDNFFFLKNSPEPAGGLSRIGVLRVDFRELYLRVDFHELENSGYFRELYLRVDFNLKFSPIFTCFVGREKVGRSSHRFLETCPRGSPDFSVL